MDVDMLGQKHPMININVLNALEQSRFEKKIKKSQHYIAKPMLQLLGLIYSICTIGLKKTVN